MGRSTEELMATLSPERRQKIESRTLELLAEQVETEELTTEVHVDIKPLREPRRKRTYKKKEEPDLRPAIPVVLGLFEAEAAEAALKAGFGFRVRMRDGMICPRDDSHNARRINVIIEKGRVAKVAALG